MLYSEKVHVVERFQKSIRLDDDFGSMESLETFVYTESLNASLDKMCQSMSQETGTGNINAAFTWTGAFGCGKSSLAVAFGALFSGSKSQRSRNAKYISVSIAEKFWKVLNPGVKGFHVLPISAERERAHILIAKKLIELNLYKFDKDESEITENEVLDALDLICNRDDQYGGIMIILDEMGQCLEHAANNQGEGVNFFQNLAEKASRSKKRLVFIGILHMGFKEYANNMTKIALTDWEKISGRFTDIAIDMAGEEQVEFISQAIISTIKNSEKQSDYEKMCESVSEIISRQRFSSVRLSKSLSQSWPLHPLVTLLLGPISKRSFGQNTRSLFAFLISREPFGFTDFLMNTNIDSQAIFKPADLWGYLRENMRNDILHSEDGKKWSIANDKLNKISELEGNHGNLDSHSAIIKTIAMLEIFTQGYGMRPTSELIKTSFPELSSTEIESILANLQEWNCVIYSEYNNEYKLSSSSDFDFFKSFKLAKASIPKHDSSDYLSDVVQLKPVLAKRKYHETGSQYWFELKFVSDANLKNQINNGTELTTAVGQFLLVSDLTNKQIKSEHDEQKLIKLSEHDNSRNCIIGLLGKNVLVDELIVELAIYRYMWEMFPELASDETARNQLEEEINNTEIKVRAEFRKSFALTSWYFRGKKISEIRSEYDLSPFASKIIDKCYPKIPTIKNELINKDKPSTQAIKARNILLKKMLVNEGEERLGIDKFPAEWGVMQSVLVSKKLYRSINGQWRLSAPDSKNSPNLYAAWNAAKDKIKNTNKGNIKVKEIYDIWSSEPYGIKHGLHSILIVTFIHVERKNVTFYREGIFRSNFTDLDIDYLLADPESIEIRWTKLKQVQKDYIESLNYLMAELNEEHDGSEPLLVAKGLINVFDNLHAWTHKTQMIPAKTIKLRQILKKANDPNKLLLDDLPSLFEESENFEKNFTSVKNSIIQLKDFYPNKMNELKKIIFDHLEIFDDSEEEIKELQKRANDIMGISGDTEMEAFLIRLKDANSGSFPMDEIASLCSKKPTSLWVDNDYKKTILRLSEFCKEFIKLEAYAYVKDESKQNKKSISFILGDGVNTNIMQQSYLLNKKQEDDAKKISKKIQSVLNKEQKIESKVLLSALAEIASENIKK